MDLSYIYYFLLGIYALALVGSLFYYLGRRAPSGDASVGWALGIFYTAGLAGILVVAFLLRNKPGLGLAILSWPLLFLAWPGIRRTWTNLYTQMPPVADAPPLTLFIENNTSSKLHIKVECWFGTARSHSATLYTTFDYYLEPLEKSNYTLTAHQTRLLAHKSKFVTIMTYELIIEEYQGQRYTREIQPCMQFYNEAIEAFRSGQYTIAINPK